MRWGNRTVANHICKTVYQSSCTIIYCALAPDADVHDKSGRIFYECREQHAVVGSQAFDYVEQSRLWAISEKLTGVTYPY